MFRYVIVIFGNERHLVGVVINSVIYLHLRVNSRNILSIMVI